MPRFQYITVLPSRAITWYAAATVVCISTVAAAQTPTIEEEFSDSTSAIAVPLESTLIVDSEIANWVKFQGLVRQWRDERGTTSSIIEMSMLPSYQSIIGMGQDALPFLLAELKSEGDDPDQWFWALMSISGPNHPQIKPEDQGDFRKMARAWLEWAEAEGYAG